MHRQLEHLPCICPVCRRPYLPVELVPNRVLDQLASLLYPPAKDKRIGWFAVQPKVAVQKQCELCEMKIDVVDFDSHWDQCFTEIELQLCNTTPGVLVEKSTQATIIPEMLHLLSTDELHRISTMHGLCTIGNKDTLVARLRHARLMQLVAKDSGKPITGPSLKSDLEKYESSISQSKRSCHR